MAVPEQLLRELGLLGRGQGVETARDLRPQLAVLGHGVFGIENKIDENLVDLMTRNFCLGKGFTVFLDYPDLFQVKLMAITRKENSSVCIEISDSGSGIPEDLIGQIFEPFFTTKSKKGSGLGLSVSYEIIKTHGGDITVKSLAGQGTTFTITLPAVNETASVS